MTAAMKLGGIATMGVRRSRVAMCVAVVLCVVVLYKVVICVAVMYVVVVVVSVLARRKRVKTMKMGVKNMVAFGLRWLVYERM